MDRPRAAIYCSTKFAENTKEAQVSIFNQKEQLAAYATAHQISIETDYEDVGYSPSDYDRPVFQQLLAAAQRLEFDFALVWEAELFLRNSVLKENCIAPFQIYSASDERKWIIDSDSIFLPDRLSESVIHPDKQNIGLYYPKDIWPREKAHDELKR